MISELTPAQEEQKDVVLKRFLDYLFEYQLVNQDPDHIKQKQKEMYAFCGLEEPEVHIVDSPDACQNLANKLLGTENKVYDFGLYINHSDFGWIAFYTFFAENTDVLTDDLKEKLKLIFSFSKTSFMSIQLEKLVIVSDWPTYVGKDEDYNLHDLEGPAIKFRDGYGQHYVNGRFIPAKYFYKIKDKTFTFEEWMQEENEEYKSNCLHMMQQLFGESYPGEFIKSILTEIDTYVDKKDPKYLEGVVGMNVGVYTLFKGNIGDNEFAYVRCYCPSTDRMFMLGVDETHTNAKDAIASLYRVPRVLLGDIKEIRRQGERFITMFTDEGKEKVTKLSEFEKKDLVGISGDKYFSLMSWEY